LIHHFKNIFSIALHLGKIAWTKRFVETYNEQLPPEIQEYMVLLSKASIAFYEKDYEEAQYLVAQIREINFTYHLNKELLLLKTFYLCRNKYLETKLESFRSYLRTNKQLSANVKKAYENFYKALKQLHRLRERYFFLKNDSKNLLKLKLQVEKLLAKLQNRDDIVSSVWLIEQTEILLRKF